MFSVIQLNYVECVKNVEFITARKRSLRRLCFYTCLSFCPRGGGWYSPQVRHLREQTPPPPGADTHPPPKFFFLFFLHFFCIFFGHFFAFFFNTPWFGQRAGGTHPTGMHSCLHIYFLSYGLLDFILEFRLVWEILFLLESYRTSVSLSALLCSLFRQRNIRLLISQCN